MSSVCLPCWGMNKKESYNTVRKYPCHQYRITRSNTNQSIESWIEYFDCFGVLQRREILPPIDGEETFEQYVCSWSYVEGNQIPLADGGIPNVLTIEQLDGCYESYYRPPGGDSNPIPPPVPWPNTTPSIPNNVPWTPSQPTPSPPPACPPGSSFFSDELGFKYIEGSSLDKWNESTRYSIYVPPGGSFTFVLDTRNYHWGTTGVWSPGIPSWFEWESDGDSGKSLYIGLSTLSEEFERIMTEEQNSPDLDYTVHEHLPEEGIYVGRTSKIFDGGTDGATYHITVKSPMSYNYTFPDGNFSVHYLGVSFKCNG